MSPQIDVPDDPAIRIAGNPKPTPARLAHDQVEPSAKGGGSF
jgi:hypothetical protein